MLYDHTSILKTVDRLLGLGGIPNLTARVRATNDFSKVLALTSARDDVPRCHSPVAIGNEQPTSTGAPEQKTRSCRFTRTGETRLIQRAKSHDVRILDIYDTCHAGSFGRNTCGGRVFVSSSQPLRRRVRKRDAILDRRSIQPRCSTSDTVFVRRACRGRCHRVVLEISAFGISLLSKRTAVRHMGTRRSACPPGRLQRATARSGIHSGFVPAGRLRYHST
jgi:hypothetical protein